jgi:hypothetical protein
MVEFVWGDPNAEKIHEGLMHLLDAVREQTIAQRATHATVLAIHDEVTRQLPPSPVPALLADIIARLERIEAQRR